MVARGVSETLRPSIRVVGEVHRDCPGSLPPDNKFVSIVTLVEMIISMTIW
jgi:hypothetical protein